MLESVQIWRKHAQRHSLLCPFEISFPTQEKDNLLPYHKANQSFLYDIFGKMSQQDYPSLTKTQIRHKNTPTVFCAWTSVREWDRLHFVSAWKWKLHIFSVVLLSITRHVYLLISRWNRFRVDDDKLRCGAFVLKLLMIEKREKSLVIWTSFLPVHFVIYFFLIKFAKKQICTCTLEIRFLPQFVSFWRKLRQKCQKSGKIELISVVLILRVQGSEK